MNREVMPLWREKQTCPGETNPFQPYLTIYSVDVPEPRGAVIVCPGGGYHLRADHEGGVVAERYNKLGFQAFVLEYRVEPYRHPAPFLDAVRAVRMVRAGAAKWNLKPDKIAILGFSAGGHLAGSLGVHYPDAPEDGDFPGVSCRPDALLLCYAVINKEPGSFQNLMGGTPTKAQTDWFQLDRHVNAQTPPAYLWHTADDPCVPIQNALDFATAEWRCGVPAELHVFPHGPHGIGLAGDFPEITVWPELSATWLRRQGW